MVCLLEADGCYIRPGNIHTTVQPQKKTPTKKNKPSQDTLSEKKGCRSSEIDWDHPQSWSGSSHWLIGNLPESTTFNFPIIPTYLLTHWRQNWSFLFFFSLSLARISQIQEAPGLWKLPIDRYLSRYKYTFKSFQGSRLFVVFLFTEVSITSHSFIWLLPI